ncbi:cysteine desulfurase NifS [Candidatus Woesearchaeota archaeon]|nr:MAG: cysteine desulfurase NifS [Candidatus Woesearchaeota archaeon]
MKNNFIYLDNEEKSSSNQNKPFVYLDNGATTKVDEETAELIKKNIIEEYGNPSSIYEFGLNSFHNIENVRDLIKEKINAEKEDNLIFNSGATESNNFAIFGMAELGLKNNKKKLITTNIEHGSIKAPSKQLQKKGFEVVYLNVDKEGFIDFDQLIKELDENVFLVSIIHANHEVGTIQDIERIGNLCKEKNVFFHIDAAQSFTKIEIDVKKQNVDLLSLNSHKIHGPKGIGALYVRKGIKLKKMIFGGPQENNLRSGTENIPGIVGFGKATEIAFDKNEEKVKGMKKLRDYFIAKVLEIPNSHLNGSKGEKRLCNNINITFDFIEGEALLMHLNMKGICISTGSACSSRSLEPSDILISMGRSHEQAHGSVRFTLSKYTTKEELDYALDCLKESVENLRKLSPLTPKQ